MTLADLNRVFNFPKNGSWYTPQSYHENAFWKEISRDSHFSAKSTRASSISNPCFKYVHRVLALIIFGHGESDSMVQQIELFFIWAMLYEGRINIAFYLAKQFMKVVRAQKGTTLLRGLVSQSS